MRKFDEAAKVTGAIVPKIEDYVEMMQKNMESN